MKNMYHFLYRTECKITKKYYIGVHSTSNLDDGYLGSGILLQESLKTYGKDNHTLEILQFFNSKEEKFQAEKNYITLEMINDPNCLNFSFGGNGGIMNENHYTSFMEAGRKAFKQKLQDPEFKQFYGKKISEANYRRIARGEIIKAPDWTGRKHSTQTIEKIKQSKATQGSGENNSQFGSCWITNGTENKKIKKGDLIPTDWVKGRKLK